MMLSVNLSVPDRHFSLLLDRHTQMLYYTGPSYDEWQWGRSTPLFGDNPTWNFGKLPAPEATTLTFPAHKEEPNG